MAILTGGAVSTDIVRVHDVAETIQAIKVWDAVVNRGAWIPPNENRRRDRLPILPAA